ncbi:tripartite tricarboxylate transporter permease [Paracoccus laeviglucosivorans]|uniref:Putative tricarboxylic transport membrane protein n=1 Tax=Paracoccus laeviglucosivorans TaxID=1197861 RepID=A0A521FU05_9RHOB|nr:tripartite tricarboxylate transporter permease [Paracoccus laeviglucosivorans]SMO99584.1 putative tricarboxylic transport membrane protein [Paracoccus laeviglucosivorans]
MSLIDNLATGFGVAFTVVNLLYALLGAVLGTLIGILPGLGPVATVAMLLPVTYTLEPTTALIMLAGIYYGAQYGGSTTAILVNLPGEASSVVTTLDGYQMAQRGRAGQALAVAAYGSLFAGIVGTLLLAALAPALASVAIGFGAAEYFSLMLLGLIGAVALASGSVLKAIAMILFGLLLGSIGTDINSGVDRYTFGVFELGDGIDFVVVAMGVFGLTEILRNVVRPETRDLGTAAIGGMRLSRDEVRRSVPAVFRGSALGAAMGLLPGGGALLSSFAAYTIEKRISKHPQEFGKGAIEGVAAPESANNAAAQSSFVPMLTLGIPANATTALLMGAMMIHNIQPGPQVMSSHPELFWGLIASMFIGNVMLVILNLPMINIWVKLLSIPYRLLYPAILVFVTVGVFSIQNSTFLILLMLGFGLLGYLLSLLDFEPAPLLLGFILGPMVEDNFRRAMLISAGDPTTFVTRPVSAVLLGLAVALLVLLAFPSIRKSREQAFQED